MKILERAIFGLGGLILFGVSAVGQEMLPFGSSWEYLNPMDGVDPAIADSDFETTWHTPAEYDGQAFDGPAPALLGYGEIDRGPIATNIGTPPSGERYTAYFRTSLTTSQAYDRLRIDLLADDGGVLYIDGELIRSLNFSGPDEYLALTDDTGDERAMAIWVLNERLEAGEHVIAFSLHNTSGTSSDLGFDLRLEPLGSPSPLDYLTWTIDAGEVTITDAADNLADPLVIPDSIDGLPVTRIGDSAFENGLWSGVVTIPEGVTHLGNAAFAGCHDLTGVVIPDSLTTIGSSAFRSCSSLTRVAIPNSVTEMGSLSFSDCSGLTSVVIPDSLTTIGNYAFRSCSGLTSVVIPDSVTEIGLSSFSNCSGLTGMTFPDSVTTIGSYAFADCSNLTSVEIPDSVVEIGMSAFTECGLLVSLTIGDGVTEIGDYAFSYCRALTSVTIPDSVEIIGSSAFSYCEMLSELSLGLALETIEPGAFDNTPLTFQTSGDFIYLTNPVAAFLIDCSASGNVVLPASLDGLPLRSVTCSNNTTITSVVIPSSVNRIGASAFFFCTSLTNVEIPNSVTDIGSEAFSYCSALTSVTIPDSVTVIGSSAFSNCRGLTSVTIPGSVTVIGSGAFRDCVSLANVEIPDGLTTISSTAFYNCRGLTSVTIPDSVTTIGSSAFGDCSGLTSVTIPDSVTVIGSGAFRDCTSLTTVEIPDSVTVIGFFAFRDCSDLTSVTIPDSVRTIGTYAFGNCRGLTSVTLGNGVTTIQGEAFRDCRSLASVTIVGTPPASVDPGAFTSVSPEAQVFVEPEHAELFGGIGANWYGLVVALIPEFSTPILITEVRLSGGNFTIRFFGEPAVASWRIAGTSDLSNFSDDLTLSTVITEPVPGQYKAVVDVSSKPDHYFFRVSR